MYIPPLFRETDPTYIRGFLQDNAFATLVASGPGGPTATHLLLETRGPDDSHLVLNGHMSRENPQWRTFDRGTDVLAIFQGPHSYVSAAWYSVPSAPTWNYLSIHAYGRPRLVEDREELYEMLKRLVDSQEGRYPEEKRYRIESLPAATLQGMMNGVVGFEISVTRVEAAAKLSQNRSAPDHQRIVEHLRAEASPGAFDVAREMERRGPGPRGGSG